MKTLYLQCNTGIAGDMLAGALYQLLEDQEGFLAQVNSLIEGVHVHAIPTVRKGITGVHMEVHVHGHTEHQDEEVHHHTHEHHHDHEHTHEHHHDHEHTHEYHHDHEHTHEHHHGHHHVHTSFRHIQHELSHMEVSQAVKEKAAQVYQQIAMAESKAHGCPVDQIHFHEVGEKDALMDILMCSLAMEKLGIDRVICSPLCLGYGNVRCAHGVLPVPAPATAYILEGVPSYSGAIYGEMTTPTGAALAKTFAHSFGEMPVMIPEKWGYGMGSKDLEKAANCVRACIGIQQEEESSVTEIVCNVDDMTGEDLGFAMEELMKHGALDVTIQSCLMKKGRPGHIITVMSAAGEEQPLIRQIFRLTTTNGVRMRSCARVILNRETVERTTMFGDVSVKRVTDGCICREKPEYDEIAAIARREGLSTMAVRAAAMGQD